MKHQKRPATPRKARGVWPHINFFWDVLDADFDEGEADIGLANCWDNDRPTGENSEHIHRVTAKSRKA